ncbi:MAG: ribulose-phosphate 3-epimerase [Micrococcales bacterium]|nr:ribulose-phosphate 3-epimerase [Micrococcales bacterium]
MPVRIAPSILAADFANLQAAMGQVSGADLIHVDVMDGHFVPNISVGLPVVKRLCQISPLPLDVHLMIDHPDRWAQEYALPGVETVVFHMEAAAAPVRLAQVLHERQVKAGVAIKPGTAVSALSELIDHVDLVLVMSVEPGFGGQSFIMESVSRLHEIRYTRDALALPVLIEVDGGIDANSARLAQEAGADILVAGNAIYGQTDPVAAMQVIRTALQQSPA